MKTKIGFGVLAIAIGLANAGCQPFRQLPVEMDGAVTEEEAPAGTNPPPPAATKTCSDLEFRREDDPESKNQEHLDDIRYWQAKDAFFEGRLGRRMKVAVIDSGIDTGHEDLKANVSARSVSMSGDAQDVSPANDHGTHVSGLLAAAAKNGKGGVGVNPTVELIMIKASFPVLDRAIEKAVQLGAEVISISQGTNSDKDPDGIAGVNAHNARFRPAFENAVRAGVSVVIAAGNSGKKLDGASFTASPTAIAKDVKGLISVGGWITGGRKLFSGSNTGTDYVKIVAPAAAADAPNPSGLLSTVPGAYKRYGGTSMSAPIVAGVVSLVKRWLEVRGISATPEQLEEILLKGSRREAALEGQIHDGRAVDLQSILEYLKARYPGLTPKC